MEAPARIPLTWTEVGQIIAIAGIPVYLKGLLDHRDFDRARDIGAAGVIISNHGGRQLDSSPASFEVLKSISSRIPSSEGFDFILDSGIRKGSHIVKALCLGASAVTIGRPALWGLAVDGKNGVRNVIDIFLEELTDCLRQMGVSDINELDSSLLSGL